MRRVRRRWSRGWNRFIILNVHERFTPGALEHPAIQRTICQLRTKTMGEHRLQREGKNEPAIHRETVRGGRGSLASQTSRRDRVFQQPRPS